MLNVGKMWWELLLPRNVISENKFRFLQLF